MSVKKGLTHHNKCIPTKRKLIEIQQSSDAPGCGLTGLNLPPGQSEIKCIFSIIPVFYCYADFPGKIIFLMPQIIGSPLYKLNIFLSTDDTTFTQHSFGVRAQLVELYPSTCRLTPSWALASLSWAVQMVTAR